MNKPEYALRNLNESKHLKTTKNQEKNVKNNDLFTLWISDDNELPELQILSLKSMLLTGHNVTLYTYGKLNNVPEGINVVDGNKILNKSKIFKYKEGFNKGSYSGFSNWFRVKRMYEKGGAWFDTDILAIKNINDFNSNENIIASQYNDDGSINPLNAFSKLKKNDKLLNDMLTYIETVKDNVKHGDTGPVLLKSMMDGQYKEYYNYLTSTNFISSINYFDYEDFLKPTKDIVRKLNFDEIWGFHIWNAMFREYGKEHEKVNSGFYHDLKEAILASSTKEEYEEKIQDIIKEGYASESYTKDKKIFSISMVKNEMDIIESFVRYNANIFDGMIILDNCSADNTFEILKLLEKEGLPLFIFKDENREYNQAFKMNQLLLKAVNKFKADLVIPLDADEFLISSNKGNPRKILEKIDFSALHLVKWKIYVPNFNKTKNEKFIPAKMTFASDNADEMHKVIIPKDLVNNYAVELTKGNHNLLYNSDEISIKQVLNKNLRIAHFPIRSKEQALSKIPVGWTNSLCDIKRADGDCWHLQKMFNDLKEHGKIEDEDLVHFAKVYSSHTNGTEIKIKEDPIDLTFCKNISIKYMVDKINPVVGLLEHCEGLSSDYLNLKKEALAEEIRFKAQIENLEKEALAEEIRFKAQIENLEKEKIVEEQRLKSKIEEYENSTSWVLTSPLRKIGSIIRNLLN